MKTRNISGGWGRTRFIFWGSEGAMNKLEIAELVLDVRSLWQMYYVEGIVETEYKSDKFWAMKNDMAKLAGLDSNMRFGCPFCEYFLDPLSRCENCPLDWPKKTFSKLPPCEHKGSPYELWHNEGKTIKQARAACDGMIELCEKWLDENGIEYEK
jgi:hypothetical protein